MLPGAARRNAWSASGETCARSRSRLAAKPPVARISGRAGLGRPSPSGSRPCRIRPIASTSASCQPVGVEAGAGGQRVAGLPLDDRRAERLEPAEVRVEALEEQALKALVAVRALRAEAVEVAVAPDHAARQPHRAARARQLLYYERVGAEAARLGGCHEPGHSGACDDEIGHGIRA